MISANFPEITCAMQTPHSRIRIKPLLAILLSLVVLTLTPAISVGADGKSRHIVAFGDSLTAGYGLPPGSDFATRLGLQLKAHGHNIRMTNAGVSGDTTSGGLARFDWAVPENTDAVILELGANDGLRGIDPKRARRNLDTILSRLASRQIPVLLTGMHAPANWGEDYKTAFDGMFAELAQKHGAVFYPFFLEGVIERPDLKLPDGLHPNAKGVDEIVRRILPKVDELIARIKAPSP